VYVGKDINVFDLLDRDDEATLQQYVDADRLQRFDASAFQPKLTDHLQRDLALLRAIAADWAPVEGDPKLDRFVEALREDPILREGKLIVFTESKETAAYLHRSLDAIMPGEVFFYASGGGQHGNESFGTKRARDFIRANYDPNAAQARDDVRLLVTTDVLAEGINLHRSNVVLNYDLPWNPTKVLQRAGRVNRVGTAHDEVFVYNFFPTTTADEHLGLEANVKAKIQAFHDTLGEDAKYLTDDEELGAFALFGEQLYRRLNDRATYEGETEEGPSELRYLKLLRDLRDHDPERFKRIKALPKKARAARMAPEEAAPGLVTFFRRDKLKKFFAATDDGRVEELTFFEAADRFACAPDTPAAPLPADFFERLARNKDAFDRLLTAGPAPTLVTTGRTNEKYILDRLKAKEVRRYHGFVEEDQALLATARRAFEDGIVPRNTSKRIKQALEKTVDPRRVLAIVRENIPAALLRAAERDARETPARREVILSAYLR
jgi:superfamily II DNA/RNA helicase